jgi:hypothetical protein
MNKRPGEAVPNATVLEKLAWAANAEPWHPPPGMIKRRCPKCSYWFATPSDTDERHCADCVIALRRG